MVYKLFDKQYIKLEDVESSCKETECGVPQGSVLEPLLFLLYINDLPNSTAFFTSLFADDAGFIKSSNNLETLFSSANTELTYAESWFQANQLTFNVSKTKDMVFRTKNMEFKDKKYYLMIGNENIQRIGFYLTLR